MLEFVCDTCSALKQLEDAWIVGVAAEAVGALSARREMNIQPTWTRDAAVHPFAVHFCSIQCKDTYMARLFGTEAAKEVVVDRTVPAEVVVEKKIPLQVTKTRTARRQKPASSQ